MKESKNVKVVDALSVIGKRIVDAEAVNDEINKLTEMKKQFTSLLKSDMNENNVREYIVDDNKEKLLSAMLTTKYSADIDNEKLMKNLTKSQISKISDVVYVCDIEAIKSLIARYPELKKELKSAVTKVETVNDKKLDYALKNGIIDIKDLRDAYTIKEVQALTVRRKKK